VHGVWYLQGSATAGSQTKAGPSQAGRTRSVVVEGGDVVVMVVVVIDTVVVVVVVVNVVVVRVVVVEVVVEAVVEVVVEVVVDVLVALVMVLLLALVVSVSEVVPLDAPVADVDAPAVVSAYSCEVPEVVETEAVLVLTTVV